MKIVFHPSVYKELSNIKTYYNKCSPNLGYEFIADLKIAIEKRNAFPNAWTLEANTRRCLLNRFPYSVIYLLKENEIYIIAIASFYQKPNYWRKRL